MPRALSTHLLLDVPVGTVVMFAGAATPSGWLLCDGSAVSRATYGGLFSAIGTTWGTGDGSTTFNLPNFVAASATTQRFPVGAGGSGPALGAATATTVLSNAVTAEGSGLGTNFIIRF